MKKLVALLGASALLLVPASASAASVKHTGKINEAPGSKVAFKAVKKQGEIVRINGFRAKWVPAKCGNQRTTVAAIRSTNPLRVKDGKFQNKLMTADGKTKIFIRGKFKQQGNKTKGTIRTSKFKSSGMTCKVPEQIFKTKAR